MNESSKKFLSLLFNPGESVCVSPDSFGYRSIPIEELESDTFLLSPQTDKQRPRMCQFSDITLISINPINGPRNDANVTNFRTFLVELDDGNLGAQFQYVKDMKMPFSACVFSGGKSLHFAIVLDRDLPGGEEMWRFYAQWILNVMVKADQQTKNPSRGIRMAGNKRNGQEMKLGELRRRINLEELIAWLAPYKPLQPQREERLPTLDLPVDMAILPEWTRNEIGDLALGNPSSTGKGRNSRWYAIAYECGLFGWDVETVISRLQDQFKPERDFTQKEWETTIRSAFKKISKK